jgi:hypothetical protein
MAREFWLVLKPDLPLTWASVNDRPGGFVTNGLGERVPTEEIHVIEYSAYEAILKRLGEIPEDKLTSGPTTATAVKDKLQG